MRKLQRYGKILVFDTLAGLCFIGVLLFGWLPGPGGLPLLIAGLALLAVNHDWAERWMETTKSKGLSIKKKFFPDNILVRRTYDALSVIGVSAGLFVTFYATNRFAATAGVMFVRIFILIFLFNRDRLDKLSDVIKKKRKP